MSHLKQLVKAFISHFKHESQKFASPKRVYYTDRSRMASFQTFFFDNEDIFPFFVVKLGHFIFNAYFLYVMNTRLA